MLHYWGLIPGEYFELCPEEQEFLASYYGEYVKKMTRG